MCDRGEQERPASCLEPCSISHHPPQTAQMGSPGQAQSFLAWSPNSSQAAGFTQRPWQESTHWWRKRGDGSWCSSVTKRVESLAQRFTSRRTLCLLQEWLLQPPLTVPVIKDSTRSHLCLKCPPCLTRATTRHGDESLAGFEPQLYHLLNWITLCLYFLIWKMEVITEVPPSRTVTRSKGVIICKMPGMWPTPSKFHLSSSLEIYCVHDKLVVL